jgi:hypothetical protein
MVARKPQLEQVAEPPANAVARKTFFSRPIPIARSSLSCQSHDLFRLLASLGHAGAFLLYSGINLDITSRSA